MLYLKSLLFKKKEKKKELFVKSLRQKNYLQFLLQTFWVLWYNTNSWTTNCFLIYKCTWMSHNTINWRYISWQEHLTSPPMWFITPNPSLPLLSHCSDLVNSFYDTHITLLYKLLFIIHRKFLFCKSSLQISFYTFI